MKALPVVAVIMAFVFFPFSSYAEELEFGTDLQVNSKYMWRGLEINKDPQFQPDAWMSYGGFTLTVWGGMDLTDRNDEKMNFSEIDYIIEYERTFDKVICGLGYIYYDYPSTDYAWTHEVFASVGYDVFLTPTLTVYRDMREGKGWYATFGLSHEIPITTYCTLALSGSLGFSSKDDSEYFYGESTNSFSDSLITVALQFPVTENITIIPSVNYTALLGPMRNENINNHDDTFWGGVNVALSF